MNGRSRSKTNKAHRGPSARTHAATSFDNLVAHIESLKAQGLWVEPPHGFLADSQITLHHYATVIVPSGHARGLINQWRDGNKGGRKLAPSKYHVAGALE